MRLVLAALVLVLAACQAPATPPAGTAVALRVEQFGGGPLPAGIVTFPDFVLYGDRTLIVADRDGPREYHLTEDEFDTLYDRAQSAGLRTARTFDVQAPDASTLEIVFGSDTGRAVTRIIAPDSDGGGDAGEIVRAVRLVPDSDLSSPYQRYQPRRIAVVAGAMSSVPSSAVWPLRPLAEGIAFNAGRCTVYDAAEVDGIRSETAWTSNGVVYQVRLRPLLPDEPDCTALTGTFR
nr:hypothetical protein [Kibdelosporangium sp. MJ126-NF4]CEL21024.1 hypothetical protein [Kibdelosporangium sp. MJ126-NF4]CTQ95462.1 hypothetical protein [Kibdelosporangium sp. MJ126-NF4]